MNEPITVGGGLLTLSLLAGTKTEIDQVTGKVTCKNVLDLPEARHTALSGTALWPGAGGADVTLFGFTVPVGQILIVDYVSMFSCAADQSTAQVDFGINANISAYWQYTLNGTVTTLGIPTGAQNLFNRPCFLVFPSGSIPQIVLGDSAAQTDQSRRILATANAWQCAENLYQIFRRYQTVFTV